MKTWLCIFALLTVATANAAEPYRTTRERVAKLSGEQEARVHRARANLDSIVLPNVTLQGVSMREAVEWITSNTSRIASGSTPDNRRGISTVSKFRGRVAETVNISMQSATLPQVLDAICAQHD